jgi:hypothetical protein
MKVMRLSFSIGAKRQEAALTYLKMRRLVCWVVSGGGGEGRSLEIKSRSIEPPPGTDTGIGNKPTGFMVSTSGRAQPPHPTHNQPTETGMREIPKVTLWNSFKLGTVIIRSKIVHPVVLFIVEAT